VRDAFASVKGCERFGDSGDLPLVGVEVGRNRFGGEERSAATSALGELLKSFFAEGSRRTENVSVFIRLQYSTEPWLRQGARKLRRARAPE
jgi:hypothetical protein